jgi:hypothetical protein
MTKAEALAEAAKASQERDKYYLALYDLVNNKFTGSVRISSSQIKQKFDPKWEDGSFTISVSPRRATFLFLVKNHYEGKTDISVYTESEVERWHDAFDTYRRVIYSASRELIHSELKRTA